MNTIELSETKKQELGAKLVSNEIYHCASYMISELSSNDNYGEELFELFFKEDWEEPALDYINNQADIDELKEAVEHIGLEVEEETEEALKKALIDYVEEDEDYAQIYCEFQDLEQHRIEIYEHWIISDWLKSKLEEKGHVCGEFLGFTLWGRPTTGQAIALDYVIQQIAIETYL